MYCVYYYDDYVGVVDDFDDVSYEIMKISIKQDFEKECVINSEK